MKKFSLIPVVLLTLLLSFSKVALTETRHGLITSAPCPFSCQDAGVPEANCKATQRGNICEVEDFTQPAGHRTLFQKNVPLQHQQPTYQQKPKAEFQPSNVNFNSAKHGLITSGTCPLTCKQLNVAEQNCKIWRAGNRCFVEDFSQPAGHRSLFK